MGCRPPNVGVLAIEVYVPSTSVAAADLEAYDGVTGKYTIGLGQVALRYCSDREDAVSLALTAVHSLLEKYGLAANRIGRLEVGSETSPDRSKSIKSHVMRLLAAAGNHDVEGVDSVHGCYGATAALCNAINWVESCSWDGRLALVVAADTALYEPGSAARATGGAGAAALLVGANAPLTMDPAWRASYSNNTDEFCRPSGPFPVYDKSQTLTQFLLAADNTFMFLHRRLKTLQQRVLELQAGGNVNLVSCFDVSQGVLQHADYFLSHAPYTRLVQKAFVRLALQDALRTANGGELLAAAGVAPRWQMCNPDALPGSGYGDKALEAVLLAACRRALEEKVAPGAWAQQRVGNAYTASLYIGLARLWEYEGRMLEGKRLLLFSFGSGVMSTLFSLVARRCEGGEFTLERVAANMGLAQRLSRGRCCTPEEYDAALAQRAVNWEAAGYTPQTSVADLEPGTWYLSQVDAQHRRVYTRKPRPAPYQTDRTAASTCSSTPSTTVQQAMG